MRVAVWTWRSRGEASSPSPLLGMLIATHTALTKSMSIAKGILRKNGGGRHSQCRLLYLFHWTFFTFTFSPNSCFFMLPNVCNAFTAAMLWASKESQGEATLRFAAWEDVLPWISKGKEKENIIPANHKDWTWNLAPYSDLTYHLLLKCAWLAYLKKIDKITLDTWHAW